MLYGHQCYLGSTTYLGCEKCSKFTVLKSFVFIQAFSARLTTTFSGSSKLSFHGTESSTEDAKKEKISPETERMHELRGES